MTKKEFSDLITNTATDTYNKNVEYLLEHHTKEFQSIIIDGKVDLIDALQRMMTSYLRSSIELSTINTISVLKNLGVVTLDLTDE